MKRATAEWAAWAAEWAAWAWECNFPSASPTLATNCGLVRNRGKASHSKGGAFFMLSLTYLTHADLYGRRANPQTLRKKLRGLGRASVLSNLAVVNNLYAHAAFLGRGHKDYPEIQKLFKKAYLRPEVRQRITDLSLHDRLVFLRLHTLYLAQLSILHSDDRKPIATDGETPGGYDLGDCSLMAGDCVYSFAEERNTSRGTEDKIIRHLGFQLGPSSEISNPLDMIRGIVRSEILYSYILESTELSTAIGGKRLEKLNIATRFAQANGLELVEYIDIIVALLSYMLVPDSETGLGRIRSVAVDSFLAQAQLPRETFENFLKLESSTVEDLSNAFKSQSDYLKQFSFMPFKARPLIEIQDGLYFCIDTFFLSEKLNAGLYWKIFDTLPKSLRPDFSVLYGQMFELYVRRIFRDVLTNPKIDPSKGILISDPEYRNGNKCFDEMIYYPNTKHLIVIETKASLMHTVAKFGKSVRKFWKEIRTKFIETQEGDEKGIGQLSKHIGNLFEANREFRQHLKDQSVDEWLQHIEKVSPVLVVQEPAISFHINEDFLNREFKKRLKNSRLRASVRIQNLTVLNIQTLEVMKQNLINKEATLEQCVNFRNVRDPKYKHDFGSLISENFELMNKTDEETNAIYSNVFSRATGRFFGGSDG
jgi:hypothetical protein